MRIETEERLRGEIWKIVHSTPAFDMHTHLEDPACGDGDPLWGMDALLTQSALCRAVFRYDPRQPDAIHEPITPEAFADLPVRIQADIIWHRCFLAHAPLTAAADSVLATLGMLGLDPGTRDLSAYRAYFKDRSFPAHVDHLFHLANLESVVLPVDPLAAPGVQTEDGRRSGDPRFKYALHVDRLLHAWKEGVEVLSNLGYGVNLRPDKKGYREGQRFLREAVEAVHPVCVRVTLPASFAPGRKTVPAKLLAKVVLPVCREEGLALHIHLGFPSESGVPEDMDAGCGGEGVGVSPAWLIPFCQAYPDVRFLVSSGWEGDGAFLTRVASACPNLMPCGAGVGVVDARGFDEGIRRQLGVLGLGFVPGGSGAEVWDALPGAWGRLRWRTAVVLQESYAELYRTGWRANVGELQRDIYNLFNGNIKRWMGLEG